MWKKALYAAFAYGLSLFLIYHFVTDKELPIQRLLMKVGLSSLLQLFGFRYFVFRKVDRPKNADHTQQPN